MATAPRRILGGPANGSYTYQSSSNASGTDQFTFRVSDGVRTSAQATVTITVVP